VILVMALEKKLVAFYSFSPPLAEDGVVLVHVVQPYR